MFQKSRFLSVFILLINGIVKINWKALHHIIILMFAIWRSLFLRLNLLLAVETRKCWIYHWLWVCNSKEDDFHNANLEPFWGMWIQSDSTQTFNRDYGLLFTVRRNHGNLHKNSPDRQKSIWSWWSGSILAKVVNVLWQEQVKLHLGHNPIHMLSRRWKEGTFQRRPQSYLGALIFNCNTRMFCYFCIIDLHTFFLNNNNKSNTVSFVCLVEVAKSNITS